MKKKSAMCDGWDYVWKGWAGVINTNVSRFNSMNLNTLVDRLERKFY